jgi:hypothetical protein
LHILFDIRLSEQGTRGRPMTDLRLPGFAVDKGEAVHIAALMVRSTAGRSV